MKFTEKKEKKKKKKKKDDHCVLSKLTLMIIFGFSGTFACIESIYFGNWGKPKYEKRANGVLESRNSVILMYLRPLVQALQ